MTKKTEVIAFDDESALDDAFDKDFSERYAKYGVKPPVDEANPTHYVNNKQFTEALVAYRKQCDATPEGQPRPRVPEYIGECFLRIARKLVMRPNFIQYTFKDEMIGDAIENCLVYVHNFDPNVYSVKLMHGDEMIGRARLHVDYIKREFDEAFPHLLKIKILDGWSVHDIDKIVDPSLNPFGYFTTYIWNAFLRRIELEEVNRYKTAKQIQRTGVSTDAFSVQDHDMDEDFHNSLVDFLRDNDSFIRDFEEKLERKKDKQRQKQKQTEEKSPAPSLKKMVKKESSE